MKKNLTIILIFFALFANAQTVKFVTDVKNGDDITTDENLIFRIYNNDILYYTTGSHINDADVTVANDTVTIVNVDVQWSTTYNFKITSVNETGNESIKSNSLQIVIPADQQAPPPDDGLNPVLSNFEVVNAFPDRLYFDCNYTDLEASDFIGFIVSGKTITGVVINTGFSTGHYFIVSSAFVYWDNNTIRYDGGSNFLDGQLNPLYNFRLTVIKNSINEPSRNGTTYWVDKATGNNADDGLTSGNAWQTITYAVQQVSAGDALYIKAANYTGEIIDINDTNGAFDNPIKVIGYKTSANDISSNYMTYGSSLSSTEMPLIDGGDRTSGRGWDMNISSYWIIKNLQFTNNLNGIYTSGAAGSSNNIFERINVADIGNQNASTSAIGIRLNNAGIGGNNRIIDSYVENCTGANIRIWGDYNLIDNVKSYADDDTGSDGATDYYIHIDGGDNNIINNCYVERVGALSHDGHGIGLKYNCQINLIVNNQIVNVKQAIELRHSGVTDNTVRDNVITGTLGTITIRDGSSDNIIEKNKVTGTNEGIRFYETSEDGTNAIVADNNLFVNNIISNCGIAIAGNTNATTGTITNNKFYFNTIYNSSPLFSSVHTIDNTNLFSGNLVVNTASEGTNSAVHSQSNYYNGFSPPGGTGNISVNPNFVDTTDFVPQNSALLVAPKITNLDYDFNSGERASTTTIGAVILTTE